MHHCHHCICMLAWISGQKQACPCCIRAHFCVRSACAHSLLLMQEDGVSEEASALAVARAHERMLQADLAQAQAAAEQPRGTAGAERSNTRQRTAAAGSQAASQSQAQQLQALSRAEQVARTFESPDPKGKAACLHAFCYVPSCVGPCLSL